MGAPGRASAAVRKALRVWHRWFGLAAAFWLLALALTGTPITFYDELDTWLNRDWRTSSYAGGPVAADAALATAREAMGFEPRFVDLPNGPGETIMTLGSAPIGPGGEAAAVQVFSHPDSGELLGWRRSEAPAFDRRGLMDTLYGLHIDLMLGEAMAWFLGLVALAWTLDHIAAAVLAFPRLAKWRESFLVAGRGWNLRRIFDLHRAPGVWFFPVTLVLAFTGVTLAWHEDTRAAVRLVTPVSERLHETFPEAEVSDPIGLDAALATAAQRTGATADSVLILRRQGVYGVRSFDPRDIDGMGRLWTYVAMADGAIVGQRHDNGEGPGDAFFAWQYPLHSGKGLGLAGRWLVFAGGLATAALCATGIWLFARRRRSAR